MLAVARGEEDNALRLVVASLCGFALACRFHSAWLAAKVPTNKWVVFGHHFAAITGPGLLVAAGSTCCASREALADDRGAFQS